MGSGASKADSRTPPPSKGNISDDELKSDDDYATVKNWNGEVVRLRERTASEKLLRKKMSKMDEIKENQDSSDEDHSRSDDSRPSSKATRVIRTRGRRSSSASETDSSGLDSPIYAGPRRLRKGTPMSKKAMLGEKTLKKRAAIPESPVRRRSMSSRKKVTSSALSNKRHQEQKWMRVKRSYKPVEYEDPRPTIFPGLKWNAKASAAKLDQAMDGAGTDEKAIIEVLSSCNSQQRNELKKVFKADTKDDLMMVIKEELSGDFLALCLAMLRDPLAFDLDTINVLLKDEKRWPTLVGMLVSKSEEELNAIEGKFEDLFEEELEEKIKKEADGEYETIFLALFTGFKRSGRHKSDPKATANALMRDADSTQDFKEGLIKMIKYETHSTIREVCEAISQMYDAELIDVIEDVLEERDQDPFKAAIAACDDTAFFFAGCLHDCLSKGGVDDDCLIRIIVGRAEIDLQDICIAYEESFHEKLPKVISKKISGDYGKMLLKIIEGNNQKQQTSNRKK